MISLCTNDSVCWPSGMLILSISTMILSSAWHGTSQQIQPSQATGDTIVKTRSIRATRFMRADGHLHLQAASGVWNWIYRRLVSQPRDLAPRSPFVSAGGSIIQALWVMRSEQLISQDLNTAADYSGYLVSPGHIAPWTAGQFTSWDTDDQADGKHYFKGFDITPFQSHLLSFAMSVTGRNEWWKAAEAFVASLPSPGF